MDMSSLWQKALKETEVIRPRLKNLSATKKTKLQYLFLANSSVNIGDTVVRRGEVSVGEPSIFLPGNMPQFKGFDFEGGIQHSQDMVLSFLMVRGITFPSLKFNNQITKVDLYEGVIDKAIRDYGNDLERKEDIETTLLIGPEEAWQFSILIFIGMQATKSAEGDFKALKDEWRHRGSSLN